MDRPSVNRRRLTILLTVGALVGIFLIADVQPAGAAITRRQNGSVTTGASGSVTPTLSSASLSGSLLVAVLGNGTAGATFSAPAGWVEAVSAGDPCCGEEEIWYYANNPGGISSATFTASSGSTAIVGQLSEWTGVASSPLGTVGSAVQTSATTTFAVSTGGSAASGDVGITGFNTSGTSVTSFTAGSGWSHLFTDLAGGHVGDYRLNLAAGSASETEKSSPAVAWIGVIATFTASSCSGGSLALTVPSSLAFSSLTLNGTDRTTTKTLALTPDDETGSGSGWNITATATTFRNASNQTLPTNAIQVTTASRATLGTTCSLPTSSVTYPVTLPAGSSPPAGVEIYNAAAGTGGGPSTVTPTFQLTVPANSFKGTYTSTWTLAIVSGP